MAKTYKTVEGDTFDLLAITFYDEERLASTIIQANPDYCDVVIFDAGVELTIPDEPAAEAPSSLPPWRRDE